MPVFDGSATYNVNGDTLSINANDLPANTNGTPNTYEVNLTKSGGNVSFTFPSVLSGTNKWIFNINGPINVNNIPLKLFFANNTDIGSRVVGYYDKATDRTRLQVIPSGNVNSYIEINLAGNPFYQSPNSYTTYYILDQQTISLETIALCFLAGSMIATPGGETLVENLCVGDRVISFDPATGEETEARVEKIITEKCHTGATGYPDFDACPVIVRRGALADSVPHTDLKITPEHCLFIDGKFVPVRMLINDVTVAYDRTTTSYTYYHIETARHAVIRANGLWTESFLDTHDRSVRKTQTPADVESPAERSKSWKQDAAAPLTTDRATVEKLHAYFAERASTLCAPSAFEQVELTAEHGLEIRSADGRALEQIGIEGNVHVFALPAGESAVIIRSHASRPCDVIGPFYDDRRKFGVLVGAVTILDNGTEHIVGKNRNSALHSGWHEAGQDDDALWTTGDASLPLPVLNSDAILRIEILGAATLRRAMSVMQASHSHIAA